MSWLSAGALGLKLLGGTAAAAGIGTGIAGGVTAATNAVRRGLNDPADGTLAEQKASQEAISDDGRLTDWGFDDKFGAFFGGPSRSDVRDAKIDAETERITKGQRRNVAAVQEALQGTGLTYTAPTFEFGTDDKDVYADQINRDANKALQLGTLAELNNGVLPSGISMSSSVPQINAQISDLKEQKQDATQMKPGGAMWTAIENQKQQRIESARLDHQFSERQREAAAERQLRRDLAGDKMQLSLLEHQGRREDRAYQRELDRRQQQQQSIMMLMKGLAQMGAGFAL